MNACEQKCFNSTESILNILSGALTGAVVATLIGCAISGTLGFTDAGVACVFTVTSGVVGGWIVGGIIGAIIAAILNYLNCKEECAAPTAEIDREPIPEEEGSDDAERVLEAFVEPTEGIEVVDDCTAARDALKSTEAALHTAEELCIRIKQLAISSSKLSRRARTTHYLFIALTAAGAMWNIYLLIGGISILIPLSALFQRYSQVKAHREQSTSDWCVILVMTRRYRRDQAQKLVDELCG